MYVAELELTIKIRVDGIITREKGIIKLLLKGVK